MAKTLVIYYSRKGQNYVNGSLKNLPKGNTEICAEYIKETVDADLFEVETVNEYSENYMVCIDEAKAELKAQTRPELKKYLDNLDKYDNVVVAGPCWWGTFPMAIFSQLEKLDFTGKNVFALMTHEGSGLGICEHDLKKYCQGASVGKGLAVHGADVSYSKEVVASWARKTIL